MTSSWSKDSSISDIEVCSLLNTFDRSAMCDLASGPRNAQFVNLNQITVNKIDSQGCKPIAQEKAQAILSSIFSDHFLWNQGLHFDIKLHNETHSQESLCFAFVVESRTAFWRSNEGVRRDFDAIYHSLDKWSAPAPALALSATTLSKTVEFYWTQKEGSTEHVQTKAPCWEHCSECLVCKGISSTDFCFVCKGKGIFKREQCRMCSSQGKYFCKLCDDTGRIPCLLCKSTGDAECIDMAAVLSIKRETLISEPVLYLEHNIAQEARKLIQTLNPECSLIAITAITTYQAASLVTVSDKRFSRSYVIHGNDCQEYGPSRPVMPLKRPSIFSKRTSSGLGLLRFTPVRS